MVFPGTVTTGNLGPAIKKLLSSGGRLTSAESPTARNYVLNVIASLRVRRSGEPRGHLRQCEPEARLDALVNRRRCAQWAAEHLACRVCLRNSQQHDFFLLVINSKCYYCEGNANRTACCIRRGAYLSRHKAENILCRCDMMGR